MANDSKDDFHKRLARLDTQKRVKTRATSPNRMGIYDFEEENRLGRAKFPWRKLAFFILVGIVGLIAVKAYVVKDMGEEAYQVRRGELLAGDRYQRFAGVLISRDPLMQLFENTLFKNITPSEPSPETKNAPDETSEAPLKTNE